MTKPRCSQLIAAARAGKWQAALQLVDLGADVQACDPDTGETALLHAAQQQHWSAVKTLLEKAEADVDDVDKQGACVPCGT